MSYTCKSVGSPVSKNLFVWHVTMAVVQMVSRRCVGQEENNYSLLARDVTVPDVYTVCRFTPRRHARRPTIAGVAADKVTKRQVNQNSNTVNCQVPTVIFVPVATGSAGTTCLIPGRRISDVTEDRHKRSRTDGCEWPVLLWFLARHNVVK